MGSESDNKDIHSLNRLNNELKRALHHFINSASTTGTLGAQLDKIKAALKQNEVMFTFASLVEQYAKMKKNLDSLDVQAKERNLKALKTLIKKTAKESLTPEQHSKILAILADISEQKPDHEIMLTLGKALEYFSSIAKHNPQKNNTTITAISYEDKQAGRRLIRDLDTIFRKLAQLYPDDMIIKDILSEVSKGYGKSNYNAFIDLLAQASCYLAQLIQKERDNAIEVLNDIHANIISVFKQAKLIEKLNDSSKNNIDDLSKTMLAELENMELKAREIDDITGMQAHIKQSISFMSNIMNNCAKMQNRINVANEAIIKELTFKINTVSSFVEDLESKLNVAEESSLIDDLTQIGNRKGYIERINKERNCWLNTQKPLSLVVLDVDNFKSVNDEYGHSTGDQVLKSLAQTLKKQIRSTDFIARYGGEEFVIILPNTDLEQAITLTQKIRQVVNNLKFELRKKNKVLKITCSYGLATFSNKKPNTIDVFNAADKALYQAKECGRDAIVVYSDDQYTIIDNLDDFAL